jgi:hypothetical protein
LAFAESACAGHDAGALRRYILRMPSTNSSTASIPVEILAPPFLICSSAQQKYIIIIFAQMDDQHMAASCFLFISSARNVWLTATPAKLNKMKLPLPK